MAPLLPCQKPLINNWTISDVIYTGRRIFWGESKSNGHCDLIPRWVAELRSPGRDARGMPLLNTGEVQVAARRRWWQAPSLEQIRWSPSVMGQAPRSWLRRDGRGRPLPIAGEVQVAASSKEELLARSRFVGHHSWQGKHLDLGSG